jgi:hypothetical protein
MTNHTICLAGSLLEAGVPVGEAIDVVTQGATDSNRRARAVCAAGGTLSESLSALEVLDDTAVAAVSALDDHPSPGTLLVRVGHWHGVAEQTRTRLKHLTGTWLALAGAVLVFAGASAMASAGISTLNAAVTVCLWAGVVVPAVAFVVLGYLGILQRRPRVAAAQHLRDYATSTWADLVATGLRSGDDFETAATNARAIVAALWHIDIDDTSPLPADLAHAIAAGAWTDQTADVAAAWSASTEAGTRQQLADLNSGVIVAAVTVLTAVLTTYTLLLALPAIA